MSSIEEKLRRYEKIDFLGEGQFATVYKAKDKEYEDRCVPVSENIRFAFIHPIINLFSENLYIYRYLKVTSVFLFTIILYIFILLGF